MMNKYINLICAFLLISYSVSAKTIYTKQDSLTFVKYKNYIQKDTANTIDKLIIKTALFFKGKPYKASTLENKNEEQLTINLQQFDCTTFVESCLALSRSMKNKQSFLNFAEQLQLIRYRHGKLTDYASRLHYVTDWIYDNVKKNIITDISQSLGGILETKSIDFMSTHINSYEALKNNISLQKEIKDVEKHINNRGGYYYLLKDKIKDIESQIKDGDIIFFATSTPGLDYTHVGIAYRHDGFLSFIHASTRTMKITVEPQSLNDYCSRLSRCTGITIVRPIEPTF